MSICQPNEAIGSPPLLTALLGMVVIRAASPGLQSGWVLRLDLIVGCQVLLLYQHLHRNISLLPLAQVHLHSLEVTVSSDIGALLLHCQGSIVGR